MNISSTITTRRTRAIDAPPSPPAPPAPPAEEQHASEPAPQPAVETMKRGRKSRQASLVGKLTRTCARCDTYRVRIDAWAAVAGTGGPIAANFATASVALAEAVTQISLAGSHIEKAMAAATAAGVKVSTGAKPVNLGNGSKVKVAAKFKGDYVADDTSEADLDDLTVIGLRGAKGYMVVCAPPGRPHDRLFIPRGKLRIVRNTAVATE